MSAVAATLAGRQLAESLMLDTCTVTAAGTNVTDDMTGEVTNTTTTVYSGKCKVQQAAPVGQRVDAGQVSTILVGLSVHLPIVGSENVGRGHIVTITSAVLDTSLVGRTFEVHDLALKSFATARRLGCQEVT